MTARAGPGASASTARRFGAQSMTAPLLDVLVSPPAAAFGCAYEDPALGFLGPVDLAAARREHDALCELLAGLGVTVHLLDVDGPSADLVYVYDALLVGDKGTIALRSGKPSRRGEEAILEGWTRDRGIPPAGRIAAPGCVDGGDTFWLRPGLFCIGRSLRTNEAGARQLAA
ncbi:MAG TPA: hypothetical protein VIV06_06840, partial [Candidatus Limnocylindrales bacterium]